MSQYDEKRAGLENRLKELEGVERTWQSRTQNALSSPFAGTKIAELQPEMADLRKQIGGMTKELDPLAIEIKETMARKGPEYKAYAPSPEMLAMRQKFLESRRGEASQAANQQKQQGQEAIARKFASLGASGSGAQLGAMERVAEASEDVRRKGMADVAGQELQIAEGDTARQFQSEMANRDMQFKQQLSNIDQANKLKGMDMAERQFEMDKLTTEFNKQMAQADLAAAGRKRKGGAMGALGGAAAGFSMGGPWGAAAGAGLSLLSDNSFICTELYRQEIISKHLWTLTGTFGQEFKKLDPEGFYGYQLFAMPLVKLMRKSKIFTKIMKAIFLPWCNWMGHQYDETIADSKQGYTIYRIMKWSMPKLYKINQTFKEQSWLIR